MFVYERPVRFEDVDAAGIVFFARFLNYCHEAMEAFFGPLDGGYVRLINERHIGLPAVHLDVDYKAPLRYGDVARIEVTIPHVGRSSTASLCVLSRHAARRSPRWSTPARERSR
ncbi:MAG: acyl-CoA thioesterase [Polyangiaceae bacterium]